MVMTSKSSTPGRDGRKTMRSRQALRWPKSIDGLAAEAIDFVALAHVLANTCRWGGRTTKFYSVAQHAVLASREVEALAGPAEKRRLALFALLAEARVAWLGDVFAGGPVSTRMEERVRRDGAIIDRAVREAAGFGGEPTAGEAELLRFADRMLEAALRRDFPEAGFCEEAGAAFPPIRRRIRPMPPERAAKTWLKRFAELAAPSPDTVAADADGANAPDPKDALDPPADRGDPPESMEGASDAGQSLAA